MVTTPDNLQNCFITVKGKNNTVEIDKHANLKNVSIDILGDNNLVKIGKNVRLTGTIRLDYNCRVEIGDNVTSTNPVYMTCAEKTQIRIGDDCMFTTNNQIRTDDAHAIYDVNTGKRINKSKDIIIGKHVWIGYRATLLAGTEIGDGSVIGAFSLVKKKFPNNCVIAGVPAKLVKKDIFWERPLLLHANKEVSFGQEEMDMKHYCIKTQ